MACREREVPPFKVRFSRLALSPLLPPAFFSRVWIPMDWRLAAGFSPGPGATPRTVPVYGAHRRLSPAPLGPSPERGAVRPCGGRRAREDRADRVLGNQGTVSSPPSGRLATAGWASLNHGLTRRPSTTMLMPLDARCPGTASGIGYPNPIAVRLSGPRSPARRIREDSGGSNP